MSLSRDREDKDGTKTKQVRDNSADSSVEDRSFFSRVAEEEEPLKQSVSMMKLFQRRAIFG